MGRPNQYRSFDAFTPTGSGSTVPELHDHSQVPKHEAKYRGRPPYATTPETQQKLRKRGGT